MKKSKVTILSICALLSLCALVSCNNDKPSGSTSNSISNSISTSTKDENNKYKVTYTQNTDYTISGLESEGYKVGDKVTFIINVTDSSKSVAKVVVNNQELEAVSGAYSFTMPEKDVVIAVTLSDIKVTSIKLNKNEVKLNLDDHKEEKLEVSFMPSGAKGEVIWDSSDASVVSVEDGKLKALKAGSATITAKLLSDFSIKETCLVTVESNYVDYSFNGIDASVTSGTKNLREDIVGFEGEDALVTINYVINAERESDFEMGINVSANTRAFKLTDVFTITLNNEKVSSNAYTKVGNCWGDYSEITVGTYHLNKGDNTITISYDKSLTDWQTFNFKSLELHAPQTLVFKNKEEPVRMTSITLDQKELSTEFEVDKTIKLTAAVAPLEASNKFIKWESSDNGIATVDKEGTVTIKGIGKATITATCEYNTEIKDTCEITVTTKQNVYAFDAIDDKVLVDAGEKNEEQNCVGVSSNYSAHIVYTFNSDKAGTINLSAIVSSHDVARKFTDVYAMKINGVTQNSEGIIPVGAMWTGYTSVALGSFEVVEGTNTIEFTYLQQALTWQSYNFRSIGITSYNVVTLLETPRPAEKHTLTILASDPNVATNGNHDAEGAIGAIGYDTVRIVSKFNADKAGKATLKATLSASPDGRAISSIYNMTVNGVSVTPQGNFSVGNQWGSYIEYNLGEIDVIEGENVIEFSYEWAVSQGWTYNYKGISLESESTLTLVNANQNIESITLNNSEATMKVGDELQLSATIAPDTVLNKNVTWESSDETLATVDKNGLVKAIKNGTVEITATSKVDNTKKATCVITIAGATQTYTFNAADDKTLVDQGNKSQKENNVGTASDGTYNAHIVYKFNSDKAGTIKLSSTVSCHNTARNFLDVYEIKINGTVISSSAVIPVGEMWTQYVQLLLGEFNFVKGENTIEVTYKQQALGWQTYNFRDIQIVSECGIELVDAN